MPREAIICDCGEELTKLASTLGDNGTQLDDPTERTEYYQCVGCKQIFKRRLRQNSHSEKIHYGDFEKYQGRFSAEQLQEYTPKTHGDVTDRSPVLPWSPRQAWQDDEESPSPP